MLCPRQITSLTDAPSGVGADAPPGQVAGEIDRPRTLSLSIAAVERDTGLSKDTLRVWERRYGFPMPARDDSGERAYPLNQVEKLRVLKRLMDAGHRPGRVVPMAFEQLCELAASTVDQPPRGAAAALDPTETQAHLQLIRAHDLRGLRTELARQLARVGTARFIAEVVAPLTTAVGDAWMRGRLEIFEEHAYTEVVQGLLHQALAAIPEPPEQARPRVLLATFPGEPHGLGLLMSAAQFALEGCPWVSLGVQTPPWDIVLAAAAYRADIVGLSFTGCLNPHQVVEGLSELRDKLPSAVRVWAGGSAPVVQRCRMPGLETIGRLAELPAQVQRWRSEPGRLV